MKIELGEKASKQMDLAANRAYPDECCGILLGKVDENAEKGYVEVLEAREATNQIQGGRKATHFAMDPLFLYQVEHEIEGSGLEVIGFFHSHPDCKAIFSEEDIKYMIPGLVYIVLSVTKEGVIETCSRGS